MEKKILIRNLIGKASIPKSKTQHQKQRKSQGTSEVQGPTLGHLAIVRLQEMFQAFSPGPVDLVPNILCHFFFKNGQLHTGYLPPEMPG